MRFSCLLVLKQSQASETTGINKSAIIKLCCLHATEKRMLEEETPMNIKLRFLSLSASITSTEKDLGGRKIDPLKLSQSSLMGFLMARFMTEL
jgi:hypothetical protein